MSLVRQVHNPTPRVYRTFGISLWATGLVVVLLLHYEQVSTTTVLVVAGLVAVCGLIPVLRPRSRAASVLFVTISAPALFIGNIVGVLALSAFFFVFLTPLSLALRVARKDHLEIRNRGSSFWKAPAEGESRSRYERQF